MQLPAPNGSNPNSDRINQLCNPTDRDTTSTPHQRALFRKFIQAKPDPSSEREFNRGFEISCEIGVLEEKLHRASNARERSQIARELRGLHNKITPTGRRAAAARNRPLVNAILEYIRENGAPSNIAELLRWLRDKGFKIAQDNPPLGRGCSDMTARKVRDLVKMTFGISGRMGRKPKII